MKPEDANSPKDRWATHTILIDGQKKGGPSPNGEGWSLAVGTWDREPVLAIRWDGDNGSAGTPQSRGCGVWFILPSEACQMIDHVPDKRLREFAKTFLKIERKAA
jgi:hypothetical protein